MPRLYGRCLMGDKLIGWSCYETVGIGIPNPRPVVKVPIPPEVADRWEREAAERGLSLDEYLDILFAEAEAADGREDPTG